MSITICTKNRENYFGKITDKKMIYSPIGNVAKNMWQAIPNHNNNIVLDEFQIMPNHVHGIINIVKSSHDDIVDTAGTLVKASDALLKQGATKVSALVTHGVLSGPASSRIRESKIDKLVITDTIQNVCKDDLNGKLEILSTASLFSETIRRIHNAESVSCLFI